jgi:hypothetical protein
MSIYVEILIRDSVESLWKHTQTPTLHERWDLRFSRIDYLPRESETDAQRFLYTTRIGFGLQISGEGDTRGERGAMDGSRSSALTFSSTDTRSIILEGSGYWKYIPCAEGTRFLTWYEYRTRFGKIGAIFNRLMFQPLMGWATAWSFDRLRLWLEDGIDPHQAMRHFFVHSVARIGLALIFAYHGLIPKLLGPHPDEVAILEDAGVAQQVVSAVIATLGIAELLLAACLLVFWHRRWPLVICLALMVVATIGLGISSPRYFAGAFNPASLNLAVACLTVIDLIVLPGVPSAGRCRRRPVSGTA